MFGRTITQQRIHLLFLFCAVFAFGYGVPQIASAQEQGTRGFVTNPLLNKGLTLYNDQRYQEAGQAFLAVSSNTKTSIKERNQALKYLAFIYILQRKPDRARSFFIDALKNDPNFELDPVLDPPKFVAFFKLVRRDFLARRQVLIEDRSPSELPTSKPLKLTFSVRDEFQSAKRFVLYYRIEGSGPYQQGNPTLLSAQKLQKEQALRLAQQVLRRASMGISSCTASTCQDTPALKVYSFDIPPLTPPDPTSAYFLEYYVDAIDALGRKIASLGSSSDPKRVKRTLPTGANPNYNKAKAAPFYQTWWFWTAVGVVVVGGVVAGVVVATAPKPPAPPTTGSVIVTIVR